MSAACWAHLRKTSQSGTTFPGGASRKGRVALSFVDVTAHARRGVKLHIAGCVLVAALVAACGPAPSASTTPAPRSSGSNLHSPPASPSVNPSRNPVLVGYNENRATISLLKMDGSVVKSMAGYPVGDELALGAYLVMTTETGGKAFTVDASGATEPVAPAAAKILTPATPGIPIIVDHVTAIVGCALQSNGSCTAEVVNMTSGEVRPLLNVPGTGAASMQLGLSLTLLNISSDLKTIWLRRVTNASAGQADIVAIDLRTDAVKSLSLPLGLMTSQILAINEDGTLVAGQEEAGTDPNSIVVQHLHVGSLLTGNDTDVQGTAPYVAGGRPPEILFAPNGGRVVWWGSLNGSFDSGRGDRLNVASTSGRGETVWLDGTTDMHVTGVGWLDSSTLLAQDEMETVTIDVTTGAIESLKSPFPYLLTVLV